MLRALRPNLIREFNATCEFWAVLWALQNLSPCSGLNFLQKSCVFRPVAFTVSGGISQLWILQGCPLPGTPHFSLSLMARCGGPSLGCQTGNTLDPGRQTLNSQLLESLPRHWPALTQTSWRHCNARKCYSWAAWQIGSTHADLGTGFGGPWSTHCPGTEPLITVYIRQSDTFQLLNDLLFPPLFSPYRTLCVYTVPRCSTSASCFEPYLMHSYQPQLRQPQGAQITAALLPPPSPSAWLFPVSVLNHLINLTWGLPTYGKILQDFM